MITLVLILAAVLLLALGGGITVWFLLRQTSGSSGLPKQTTKASPAFHWRYIALPLVILLLAAILTAYFYPGLPTTLAYHFRADGSPDRWLSREAVALWMLAPQLLLTLLAAAITWGMTRLGALFSQAEGSLIRRERILMLIGNMMALPQVILGFTLLDIFSYNSYQVHILPAWLFALIVAGAGGITLSVFFIREVWRTWAATSKSSEERQ